MQCPVCHETRRDRFRLYEHRVQMHPETLVKRARGLSETEAALRAREKNRLRQQRYRERLKERLKVGWGYDHDALASLEPQWMDGE